MKKNLKYFLRTLLVLFIFINLVTAFHAYKFTHFYTPDANQSTVTAKRSGPGTTKEIFLGVNAYKRPNTPPEDSTLEIIRFTTEDNTEIESWYLPGIDSAKGTVILFHGHGSNKSGVLYEAETFRKMGYNTMLVDFRAHGGSGGNTCTIGYYESEEVKLAYDFIKKRGENNIILWGISMGAATITKAMNDYPIQPSKIILEMPFGSIMEAAGGRIQSMGVPKQPLAMMITFWGGAEHGFWAFHMNPAAFAKKITVPTLLQWGSKDKRVTEKETDDVYTNIAGDKKLVVYEQSGHQSLCKNEHDKWLDEVEHFLSR